MTEHTKCADIMDFNTVFREIYFWLNTRDKVDENVSVKEK